MAYQTSGNMDLSSYGKYKLYCEGCMYNDQEPMSYREFLATKSDKEPKKKNPSRKSSKPKKKKFSQGGPGSICKPHWKKETTGSK